jgi:hypothetical protein
MVDVIERVVAWAPMMTQGQAVATVANIPFCRCCITGCIFSSMELIHRPCHTCKEFIHILCAEPFNDLSEEERYCNTCVPKK